MISDIFLLIWTAFNTVLYLVTLPLKAVFDLTGLDPQIAAAFAFLFAPLRYLAYWLDLAAFASFVVNLIKLLTVWLIWKLILLGVSAGRGTKVEHPKA